MLQLIVMGKSIFIEGIDGSGKSTATKQLVEFLQERGEKVLFLREPGGSQYYEAIREHIHFQDYKRSPLSDMLTCAGGIAENIQLTKAAMNRNEWVVSDRSYVSNYVYQVTKGLNENTAEQINKLALGDFNYDIKILIDVSVPVAHKRLEKIDKKKDRWETLGQDYFQKVRETYLNIARKENFVVINGEQSVEEVKKQLIDTVGL